MSITVQSRKSGGGESTPLSIEATSLGCRNAAQMDMRQYIAVQALQGILAKSHNDASFEGAARDAVEHADALLEELAK